MYAFFQSALERRALIKWFLRLQTRLYLVGCTPHILRLQEKVYRLNINKIVYIGLTHYRFNTCSVIMYHTIYLYYKLYFLYAVMSVNKDLNICLNVPHILSLQTKFYLIVCTPHVSRFQTEGPKRKHVPRRTCTHRELDSEYWSILPISDYIYNFPIDFQQDEILFFKINQKKVNKIGLMLNLTELRIGFSVCSNSIETHSQIPPRRSTKLNQPHTQRHFFEMLLSQPKIR